MWRRYIQWGQLISDINVSRYSEITAKSPEITFLSPNENLADGIRLTWQDMIMWPSSHMWWDNLFPHLGGGGGGGLKVRRSERKGQILIILRLIEALDIMSGPGLPNISDKTANTYNVRCTAKPLFRGPSHDWTPLFRDPLMTGYLSSEDIGPFIM